MKYAQSLQDTFTEALSGHLKHLELLGKNKERVKKL
jgi:hypothetical protein